jgi:hypothetical protein
MADFWQDDAYVLEKLAKFEKIQSMLNVLKNKSLDHLSKSGAVVYKKFRHVNPHFIDGGKLVRLLDADPDFARDLQRACEANRLGIAMPNLPGS